MILTSPYTLSLTSNYSTESLNKGTWLVVLHASRIPPHIGLLIDGSYNSLTIKGKELDDAINVLLKTIQLKKIEAIFISLIKQPVFSTSFQLEIAKHFIQQYHQVKANEATCLTPIKLFLSEFYAIENQKDELFFQLVERLKQNHYINYAFGINLNESTDEFALPMYTDTQLQDIITAERMPYYND